MKSRYFLISIDMNARELNAWLAYKLDIEAKAGSEKCGGGRNKRDVMRNVGK